MVGESRSRAYPCALLTAGAPTTTFPTPPPTPRRFLTDSGIEYLREFLNLPSEIVPATLKKSTRPLERDSRPPRRDGPPRRFGGDREGYRGAEGKTGAPGEYRPEVSTPPAGSPTQDGRGGPGQPRVAAGGRRQAAAGALLPCWPEPTCLRAHCSRPPLPAHPCSSAVASAVAPPLSKAASLSASRRTQPRRRRRPRWSAQRVGSAPAVQRVSSLGAQVARSSSCL